MSKRNNDGSGERGRVPGAVLWSLQGLLAAAFGMAGAMKLFTSAPELAASLDWEVPMALVRFIGVAEILGAAGLVLPALTRVLPGLTPLAALGLVVVMVLAFGHHLGREEFDQLLAPAVLAIASAVVVWGRIRWAPIQPRNGTLPSGGAGGSRERAGVVPGTVSG